MTEPWRIEELTAYPLPEIEVRTFRVSEWNGITQKYHFAGDFPSRTRAEQYVSLQGTAVVAREALRLLIRISDTDALRNEDETLHGEVLHFLRTKS